MIQRITMADGITLEVWEQRVAEDSAIVHVTLVCDDDAGIGLAAIELNPIPAEGGPCYEVSVPGRRNVFGTIEGHPIKPFRLCGGTTRGRK